MVTKLFIPSTLECVEGELVNLETLRDQLLENKVYSWILHVDYLV